MRDFGVKNRATQHGVAAVEFAIVLPVLLLLMIATAELGRAFYQYDTLTKAVRDGARYLSTVAIKGATVIDIDAAKEQSTKNLVVYGEDCGDTAGCSGVSALLEGLSVGDITVTQVDAVHVGVTAAYTYAPIFPFIPTFGFGGSDSDPPGSLTASITMRAL